MARHAWIAGTLSVAKHVAVWALALGLHTALTSDASIPFAVVNGGLIGLMVGIAERAFLDGALRRRRRRPFMAVIAQRAAVYTTCWVTSAVVIVGTVLATSEWSLANLSGDDPRQEDFWAYYNSFRPTNISLQGALGVAFLLSFARQVNALLGKGVLLKYVLGKYHRPRTEERVFMFLDLN